MPADLSPIALALGRIPTGLYVVTALEHNQRTGFIGSFLMQVGFDPPVVCVAIKKGRPHLESIRRAGRFAVSVLDPTSQGAMKAFLKKSPDGKGPFEQLAFSAAPGGSPVLDSSLAWIECRLWGEHDSGDHVVVFGVVESGKLAREADPSIHLRRNGLDY